MLVSTILYYILFTATEAFGLFLIPNAGILSLVRGRCGLHKLPSLKRVFHLCNFNYVKCTCFLGMF